MNKMLAYCGLNCAKCDAYLATINNDQVLREKTAKLWSELNNVQILPEDINCEGCRTKGHKTIYCDKLCPIRQCALKKQVASCGTCEEMENCPKVGMVTATNAEALANLRAESRPVVSTEI